MAHHRQGNDNAVEHDGKSHSVPACFFFADAIDRKVTGLQVCKACELTSGSGSIIGAQRLYGLWRVYPATQEARNQLLMKGISINKIFIPIVGVSPMIAKGSQDSPAIKLIVGNIPLSVANEEIEKVLRKIEGVKIRSKIFYECYRDDEGKLTLFKSGRRFLYIDVPPKPLPFEFQVGPWKPSLYHYGQKKGDVEKEVNKPKDQEDVRSEDRRQSGDTNQPNTNSVSSHNSRSRPMSRSPRDSQSRSESKPRSRNKRINSGEHARSPSVKSSRHERDNRGRPSTMIDYFEYEEQEQQTSHHTARHSDGK